MAIIHWYENIARTLGDWWHKRRRHKAFTGVAWVEAHEDPAPTLRARKLVLIGSAEKPKWIRFLCPCRCGEVTALNLMQSYHPHWRVEVHPDKTLTIEPSVDNTVCKSHFWVQRNRIFWV